MSLSVEMWRLLTILMGGVATLAVFSFLIKENSFYRFFEHVFIGIAAGLGAVLSVQRFLWRDVFVPMLGLDIVQFPDGTFSRQYQPLYLLYLLPMIFGMFYYFIFSKRFSWMAKLVIGFSLGISGGLAFKGFFNQIMPQIFSSFKPLLVFEGAGIDWGDSLRNIFFVFTLLSVMYYFFFSFRSESGMARRVSVAGRWLMMISFGAFFGSTVMARMALLVERLQFLLNEWALAVGSIFI
ncbi:MAG: hypothetical protein KDD42_00505 [Bdellovibrionales bacterium]|nr:hypothetical protein [Bdellovibrionales bacterium]